MAMITSKEKILPREDSKSMSVIPGYVSHA